MMTVLLSSVPAAPAQVCAETQCTTCHSKNMAHRGSLSHFFRSSSIWALLSLILKNSSQAANSISTLRERPSDRPVLFVRKKGSPSLVLLVRWNLGTPWYVWDIYSHTATARFSLLSQCVA